MGDIAWIFTYLKDKLRYPDLENPQILTSCAMYPDPEDRIFLIVLLLCTHTVIPSFVNVCIYFECFSPVAIFRTGFSFVEYCCGNFRAFLQSDY